MKTINTFLIEKLRLDKNTFKNHSNNIGADVTFKSVNIPKSDIDDYVVHMSSTWKTFKLPESRYIVFKDKYRNDKYHFQTTIDFIQSLVLCEFDYEDFNPHDDIIFASNDLQEILEWYFEYMGINEMPTEDNLEEWADKYQKYFNSSNDNINILADIYVGNDKYFDDAHIVNYSKMAQYLKEGNLFSVEK